MQTFKFSKTLNCIRHHIQLPWKLKVVIKFNRTLATTNAHFIQSACRFFMAHSRPFNAKEIL